MSQMKQMAAVEEVCGCVTNASSSRSNDREMAGKLGASLSALKSERF